MRMFLSHIWRGWKEVAVYIGDFQARLLLTLFYFTVAMPFALLVRWISDPLRVRVLPVRSSWVKRQVSDRSLAEVRRQF